MRRLDARLASIAPTALLALGLCLVSLLYAPGVLAAEAECPNEQLRAENRSTQLPECRAYERVTPAYTDSAISAGVSAVSPEGSHVMYGSVGAFGGTSEEALGDDQSVLGAKYELTRVPGQGWSATAVGPKYSEFVGNGMFDASTNLSATLWELGRIRVTSPGSPPEEARCPKTGELEEAQLRGVTDFYLERPIGTFTRIGPPTPNLCAVNTHTELGYAYIGASEDLSHIFFSADHGLRWPFDETIAAGGTLYEYTGVERPGELEVEPSGEPERKPALVGVEGGPGSRALVSQCGTRLGSSSSEELAHGSMYNAISASGRRVFFTAVGREEAREACTGPLWGELYAREEAPVAEGEAPAAVMRTVAISQPTREDCSQCVEEVEPQAAAVFQGASRDGSRVFFTTAREMFPGVTGVNLYEYDFDAPAGERVQLLSSDGAGPAEVQGVARVSEDGSHVYFVADGVLTPEPNERGEVARAGEDNLYVHDEGHTVFIARLGSGDSQDWAREDLRPVLTSENGDLLAFTSVADLTDEGLDGRPEVFQYNAVTGTLVRASIGENGYEDDGRDASAGSTLMTGFQFANSYAKGDSPTQATGIQAPSDGALFFSSPDALTPGALHDQYIDGFSGGSPVELPVPNIYEYRAGNVYLLSDGHDLSDIDDGSGVALAGWDPSGQDVFFLTADSLIPSDANTQQDLYDARVEGGFATPQSPAGCGETCQGALSGSPSLAPLGGSATQFAEPPLAAPPSSDPVVAQPPEPSSVLARARKLATALRACRKDRSRVSRGKCEKKARRADGEAAK